MSVIEQKWRNTGLLDENEGIDAELLAHNLDQSAKCLIEDIDTECNEFRAATFLPIMVILFNDGMRILDIEKLYHNYKEWMVEIPAALSEEESIEAYLKYIKTEDRIETFML